MCVHRTMLVQEQREKGPPAMHVDFAVRGRHLDEAPSDPARSFKIKEPVQTRQSPGPVNEPKNTILPVNLRPLSSEYRVRLLQFSHYAAARERPLLMSSVLIRRRKLKRKLIAS